MLEHFVPDIPALSADIMFQVNTQSFWYVRIYSIGNSAYFLRENNKEFMSKLWEIFSSSKLREDGTWQNLVCIDASI